MHSFIQQILIEWMNTTCQLSTYWEYSIAQNKIPPFVGKGGGKTMEGVKDHEEN